MADNRQTTLLWTALPHGLSVDNGKNYLNLSVFASIRLYNNKADDLSLSPNYDDMLDWAGKVKAGLKFHVVFDGGPTFGPNDIECDMSKIDPALWKSIFTAKTTVTPYVPPGAPPDSPVMSYPAGTIQDYLTTQYTDIAVHYPDHYPDPGELSLRLDKLNLFSAPAKRIAGEKIELRPMRATVKANLMQKLSGVSARLTTSIGSVLDRVLESGAAPLKPETEASFQSIANELHTAKYATDEPANLAKAFAQFAMFHAWPPGKPGKSPQKMVNAVPSFEFHEGLSHLGEYPELMKVLGLILEIRIPYTANPPAGSAVYVVPYWSATFKPNTINMPCKTRLDTSTYWPATDPTTSDIKNGLLDLSDPKKYEIVQLDLDGAAKKLMILGRTLQSEEVEAKLEKPVLLADASPGGLENLKSFAHVGSLQGGNSALPTLRTTGLSVVRTNLSAAMYALINNAYSADKVVMKAHASPGALPKASASAVLQHFGSPDVQTTWSADQLIRGYRIDIWDSDTQKWHSLCKRVGTYKVKNQLVSLPPDEGCVGLALSSSEDKGQDIKRLSESLFKWDGWSLVASRPGKTIQDAGPPTDQNNANVVNMMGVGINFTPPPQSLPRLRFGTRYRVRARAVDLAGNSRTLEEYADSDIQCATPESPYLRYEPVAAPTVVFRTKKKPGESIEHIVVRSNFDSTVDDYDKKNSLQESPTERHIVAPQASQAMIEMHRKLDGMTPAKSYDLIANQKDGWFGMPKDPNNATLMPDGNTLMVAGETVIVPYLADPFGNGATLRFYDREWKPLWSVETHEFYDKGDWPEPQSFRLRITEGDQEPKWEKDGPRILTVSIPKAEVLHVRYSCSLKAENLPLHALWKMIDNRSPSNKSDLKNMVVRGLHWMLTPFREMNLVHAVQQPLEEPKFDKLVPIKEHVGATYALLNARILNHAKSSVKVDVRASWDEPVDDLLATKWSSVHGEAQVFDLPVGEQDNTLTVGAPEMAPQLEGGTPPGQAELITLQIAKVQTKQVSSAKQKNIVIAMPKQSGVFEVKKHEFGDTKYRKVKYHAVATTRFREYFLDMIDPAHYAALTKPAVTEKGAKQLAKVELPLNLNPPPAIALTRESSVEVKVLNSARPALPKILYVVPLFEWERKEDDVSIIRRRCGGGFRVYMDRPWYSSGDEELLGVVLARDHSILTTDNHPMQAFITEWGFDPIWKSMGKLKVAPTIADFPNAVRTQNGVTIEERPNERVDVVGHDVLYDEDRKLWYSDIFVTPGSTYFPFVRFAFVRYQPNSIADCFVSKISQTDFIQVIPDRVAAVTYDAPQKVRVQVAGVFGLAKDIDAKTLDKSPTELLGSAMMTATLERRAGETDFGWFPVGQKQAPVPGMLSVNPDAMTPEKLYGTKMLWSKEIELPEVLKNARGQNNLRVVIKEYELYQGQDNKTVPRLIYADAIEL